jgi:DNA-binding transcriptional regulator LsrR (DeoR family)
MGESFGRISQLGKIGQIREAQEALVVAEAALLARCCEAMAHGCTGAEVAAALGVSRATLYRMIDEG